MKEFYLEFWTKFVEFVNEKDWNLEANRKPRDVYYYDISVGVPGIHLSLYFNKETSEIFTGIYVKETHQQKFLHLQKNRNKIEKLLGYVKWVPDTGKGVSRIKQGHKLDIRLKSNWEEAFNWLGIKSMIFKETVKIYSLQSKNVTK